MLKETNSYCYSIFRILVGLLFIQHGFQKVFGFFGGVDGAGGTPPLFGFFGVAGLLELIIGAALILGLFTSFAAAVGAIEMLVGYAMVHLPNGFFPILNNGELALMYLASFLVLARYGGGRWSLADPPLFKKMRIPVKNE